MVPLMMRFDAFRSLHKFVALFVIPTEEVRYMVHPKVEGSSIF